MVVRDYCEVCFTFNKKTKTMIYPFAINEVVCEHRPYAKIVDNNLIISLRKFYDTYEEAREAIERDKEYLEKVGTNPNDIRKAFSILIQK